MERGGYVYILANKNKTVLYTGVTSDLRKRVEEHRAGIFNKSFTSRYNVYFLMYYEGFHYIDEAIAREKQIKAGSRKKKEALINSMNSEWKDLMDTLEE